MVEREFLGGDCLVSGCVPSKGLIHAGRTVVEEELQELKKIWKNGLTPYY